MYFKQIQEIIDGTKTQTRRVYKPGESYLFLDAEGQQRKWDAAYAGRHATVQETILEVYHRNMARLKWQVGRTYAVSPGRGKPGVWWNPNTGEWSYPGELLPNGRVATPKFLELRAEPLRILLAGIRLERLQDITEADARAEGVETYLTYDIDHLNGFESYVSAYRYLWGCINGAGSWDKNPLVWVLEFEVAR